MSLAWGGVAVANQEGEGLVPQPTAESSDLRVVHVKTPLVAAVRVELDARGISVISYFPDQTLLVAAPPGFEFNLEGVIASELWTPAMAVGEVLASLTPLKAAQQFPAGVPVILGLAPGTPLDEVRDRLVNAGAWVSWTSTDASVPQIGLRMPPWELAEVMEVVSGLEPLVWADLQPPLRLHNSESVWRCQSGRPGEFPIFDQGIHGEGQVVGVIDTGLDIDHCMFDDPIHGFPALNGSAGRNTSPGHRKVLAVDFYWNEDWPGPGSGDWDDQSHGTHVAGSVAGDVGGDGLHQLSDGMAPAAKLVIQDGGFEVNACSDLPGLGCPLRPLEPVLQQAYDQGARINSNSWGDEEDSWPLNRYTERTADVDRFIWNHRDFLAFFSAGNAGRGGDDTVASPSTGKNVVSVGATERGDVFPPCVAVFSSRGWTHDGRIKPDLVVPGSQVVSALSDFDIGTNNCDSSAKSGTSMSCPTAAGLGVLVRQYYEDGFYPEGVADPNDGFSPSGALVKATLIGSAVDITTLGCTDVEPIPSRDQGWGLVQLEQALVFPGDDHWLFVDDHTSGFESSTDESVAYGVTLAAPGPLKVVLVWTDPPSSSLAAVNLVNDLDLVVAGPQETFYGNYFAEGVSVSGGVADRLNNLEVVYLSEARAGNWTITVNPHNIAMAGQDFAVVVIGTVTEGPPPPRRVSGRRVARESNRKNERR